VATRRFDWTDFVWLFGAYALCGLTFGGTALGIRFLRGRDRLANGTFPVLWLAGLFAFTGLDLYGPYRLFRLNAACESWLFAGLLHMALVFPAPARLLQRHPRLPLVLYALALPLAFVSQLTLHDPHLYIATHLVASSAIGAATLILVVSQVGRFLRPPSFQARQRVKVFVLGSAAVLTPAAASALAAAFTGGRENWSLIALTVSVFPFFIGYAVLRHNLLQVDEVLRRSLGYAVLTAGVAGLYVAIVAVSSRLFLRPVASFDLFSGAAAVLCAVALLPARDRVQSLVDRVFFHTTYDFRRVVETTSERLASFAALEPIADEIERAVAETLHPGWLALFDRPSKGGPMQDIRLRGAGVPKAVEEIESLAGAGPSDAADGALAVPLRAEGEPRGLLLLGPRRSGRFYGAEDRRLLHTLANQAALAIENARAVEDLRQLNRNLEAKVEQRTAALASALKELQQAQAQLVHREKMASIGQFVAGIAHEINNPLSFIEGNLHFLRAYARELVEVVKAHERELVREPRLRKRMEAVHKEHDLDRIVEDLDSVLEGCAEGVQRTTALVRDLRTFSRLDQPERMPVDLHEAIDSTLNLLRGRLVGIDVVKEYGAIPPVECLAGQINQVIMNLVANAMDALGESGRLCVRTEPVGAGRVALEVEDDGCGIEPEYLERIFEPFFTTKEVGRGTGLGLAITYGIVQRHGGEIRVKSRAGEGTCFRVEVPVVAPGLVEAAAEDEAAGIGSGGEGDD